MSRRQTWSFPRSDSRPPQSFQQNSCVSLPHSDSLSFPQPSQRRSQTQSGKLNTKLPRISEEAEAGGGQNKDPHQHKWADQVFLPNAELRQHLKDPMKSTHWRTLTKGRQTHTRTHSHDTCALTHARTHTHSFTRTYQRCLLKLRLDHQQVFRLHLKSSIVKMACILEVPFELATAPVTCFMIAHLLFTSLSFILREDTAF